LRQRGLHSLYKGSEELCAHRESNPDYNLGRVAFYH